LSLKIGGFGWGFGIFWMGLGVRMEYGRSEGLLMVLDIVDRCFGMILKGDEIFFWVFLSCFWCDFIYIFYF
jgi:hypothetical protein